MKVQVRGYAHTVVNMTPSNTLQQLKSKIQDKTGYNVNTGAILIAGKKYQGKHHNQKTLKNLGVQNGSTVSTVSASEFNNMNGGKRKTRVNRKNRKNNMTRRRR